MNICRPIPTVRFFDVKEIKSFLQLAKMFNWVNEPNNYFQCFQVPSKTFIKIKLW